MAETTNSVAPASRKQRNARATANSATNSDTPAPDAELLAVCERAVRAERLSHTAARWRANLPAAHPRAVPLSDLQNRLEVTFAAAISRAAAIPTRTLAGARAKADLVLRDLGPTLEAESAAFAILLELAGRT